ncbi:alpha-L-fucosidase [Micromonospora sp. 067-2]|uniref:alpha-L-fucosidase n=1 Tax=Micromonospora sp. 067-2 TaxID=2789270 RepID=UPI00397B87D7
MSVPPFSRRAFLAALGITGAAAATTGITDAVLGARAQAAIPGPSSYTASWSSVDQHPPAAEWFQDAKFGIYFHWGVFSVPAYGSEWYGRNMYIEGQSVNGHHKNAFGEPAAWPYHYFINGARDKAGNFVQFAPKLKSAGGKFDPNEWAQLFADAGARYAGPVAEHHDGFSMWDSTVNEWNSVDKGPKLDLLKLHADAIRAKGLKLVVAMHHAFNFTGFYEYAPIQSDNSLKKLYGQLSNAAEQQLWYDKLKEVVDHVQPDVLWQDFNLPRVDEAQRLKFLAYYYNRAVAWNKEVVATYKDGFNNRGEVYDYERGGPADIVSPYWLTDDCISSSSWSYVNGLRLYALNAVLHAMIDRVSKGGNLLLNISPMADGTIPNDQRNLLLGIGDYLRRFGESIYSTRHWTVYGEGPTKMGGGSGFSAPKAGTAQDIRFTRNKANTVLYATILGWPGSSVNVTSLSSSRINLGGLTSVQLLGSTAGTYINLPTRNQDGSGLRITLPSSGAPFSAPAYVVKLTFSGQIGGGGGAFDPNRQYAITCRKSGKVADVSGTSTADGAPVVQWTNNSGANQRWYVQDAGGGFYKVINVRSGKALDIGGGSSASAAAVVQNTWTGANSQQWSITSAGGYYTLTNRNSGLVVDVNAGSTADGATLIQYRGTGATNQQWSIG